MSCSAARCLERYVFSLFPPYRPPSGGWSVPELPPGLIDSEIDQERLSYVWKRRAKSQNNNADGAISEVIDFLRQNGLAVTKAKKFLLSQYADNYWCSLDPARCPGHVPGVDVVDEEVEQAVDTAEPVKLRFALAYWETFNRMLASDSDTPAEDVDHMARVGLALLAGDGGCDYCLEHWKSHLESFPPIGTITDNPTARIWVWVAHNRSRQGLPPTAYDVVQRGWKWPLLTGDQVMQHVQAMGLDSL